MKIISLIQLLIFLTINLYADKNWIQIQPINKTKIAKPKNKLDTNLSKAVIFKQLVDTTRKKEKENPNPKNWFILNHDNTK